MLSSDENEMEMVRHISEQNQKRLSPFVARAFDVDEATFRSVRVAKSLGRCRTRREDDNRRHRPSVWNRSDRANDATGRKSPTTVSFGRSRVKKTNNVTSLEPSDVSNSSIVAHVR